eukprot:TRINITY_DN9064_c0_g1_i1.p2 TRINITY_DN9064_c0_g1~~TRINITY_DN9064_c0_g1_i1.p2  ORF type:complete len:251 (+),score=59.31 TRINITY_DN9064_c0_g1_i1:887-1639(+)
MRLDATKTEVNAIRDREGNMGEPEAKKPRVDDPVPPAMKPSLYSYWRSSCSWRVRIALEWKGIAYDYHAVNLLKGEQQAAEYGQLSTMQQVPTLVHGPVTITQSLAILDYLEEKYPSPPLLPADPETRAKVREVSQIIASGIQPLQNLSVINKVAADFGEQHKAAWAKHYNQKGLQALEPVLAKYAGKFSVGDELTQADCCLIPQAYNATRWGVDLSEFPTIKRIVAALEEVPAVKAAHPDSQPDAPKKA